MAFISNVNSTGVPVSLRQVSTKRAKAPQDPVYWIHKRNKLEIKMTEERDWRHYVTLIGLAIEDTIPNPSEIETLDVVRSLVREVNSLRRAVGLPTYAELAAQEEKERGY